MTIDRRAREREALTPLVPLVDRFFERGDLMKARGWFSFEPYWKFRQSLCSSDEWEVHEKFHIEATKERLGNYCSEFLKELRAKQPDPIISYLTECDRIHAELERTKEYAVAWDPFKKEMMRLRQREIGMHATHVSLERSEDDEQIRRIRIWGEVVKEMGQPIGLRTNSKMSSRSSPIFRCALTEEWDFALGVDVSALGSETADKIAKPPGMDPLPIGAQITWRALVPAAKSKVSPRDSELIFVPQVFFPFGTAYKPFWDLEGLEINIRAEMTALAIIWPELMPRLIDGVSGIPKREPTGPDSS